MEPASMRRHAAESRDRQEQCPADWRREQRQAFGKESPIHAPVLQSDPDLHKTLTAGHPAKEHIGSGQTGPHEGFLAIGAGGSAHIAFHPREARTPCAAAGVRTGGTDRKITGPDGTYVFQLAGMPPDIDE